MGIVEASNKEAAFEVLKAHGLYVTAVEEIFVPIYAKRVRLFGGVSNRDLMSFSRQLAIMFKSRVSLTEIFRTLAKQTKKADFKDKILKIAEGIEGGNSLSDSLAMYPKIFSTFYVQMVKAGEASGKLTDIFSYLADYLEKDYNFRSKIKGAMIYPLFIILVFFIVSSIIVLFVIPQLTEVLKEGDAQLPWITRVVIAATDFLRKWYWLVFLVIILAVLAVYRFAKTESGKKFFDRNLLKVPLLGGFLKTLFLSRFALNLSTLISGGLPIVRALEITSDVVGNDVYKNIIIETKNEVRKGEAISVVLQRYSRYVTPLFYQMIVVGEKTGTLDSTLKNVVSFYEADVDRNLDQFVKLLEPIMIIVLGLVVGGLMAAVLMPIYSFSGSM